MHRLLFAAALLAALALSLPAPAAETTNIEGAQPNPTAVSGKHAAATEPVPPAPASFILDQASVLLPDAAARLTVRLTAASAADVHVYVVTVSSLQVSASKQSDRLSERSKEIIKAWVPKKVGAVVIFDDESGLMTVDFSPETERRFTGFAIEDSLREPLRAIQQSGLARDKLARSAEIVTDTLIPLQAKWIADSRRRHISNLIMGAVALLGVGLTIFSAVRKPEAPAVTTSETSESKSSADF